MDPKMYNGINEPRGMVHCKKCQPGASTVTMAQCARWDETHRTSNEQRQI